MFFRFRPDSSDPFEPSGKKITRLIGSLLVVTSVYAVSGAALAEEDEDSVSTLPGAPVSSSGATTTSGTPTETPSSILTEDQFEPFEGNLEDKDKSEEPKKTESKSGSSGTNGNGNGKSALLGVGVSEMIPTEFVIESDQYGTGKYRRYIGYHVDDKGNETKSGKLVQEILVDRDDANEIDKLPKLAIPMNQEPEGLQVTGFVAVKMWLSTVLTKYNGCVTKPKKTRNTTEWIKRDYEDENSVNDCALSFRLTVDNKAPGKLVPHKSSMFLSGQLCRYPEGNTEFNSEMDDAECVDLPVKSVPKQDRMFLSERDERLRAVKSVLLAQEVLAQEKAWAVTKTIKDKTGYGVEDSKHADLGKVFDMFSLFIDELSSLSSTAYDWQIDAEYLGAVSKTSAREVIRVKDLRFNRTALEAFLKSYQEKGGFTASSGGNVKSAGVEVTTTEMRVPAYDEETGEEAGEAVAYVFKLESNKGMSFEHENGEKIELLDNSKMSPLGKMSVKVREVQARLNRCQAARLDALGRCKKLEDEKARLTQDLEAKKTALENAKALLAKTTAELEGQIQTLTDKLDQTRSDEEMEAVEDERRSNRIAMGNLEATHANEIKELELKHNLTVSDAQAEYQVKINQLNIKLTEVRQDAKLSDTKAGRLEKLQKKLEEKVSRLEKDLKDAEEELNGRVTDAKNAYWDQIQALKKENTRLEIESDNKGTKLREAGKDKQQALREERLKHQAQLENLRGTLAESMAKVHLALKEIYDKRGSFSDAEDPSNYVLPSFDVVNDADGRPKPAFTSFQKKK